MDTADIVSQCRKEYEAGLAYKQGRIKDWQATEDLYFGRVKKTLKGRFNIPMPVMSGFIDTLMSKIDDSPILRYQPSEEADFRSTKKIQSAWDAISGAEDNDLASKDLDAKKLAAMSGRAIFKVYGESDPAFKFCVHVTDHYDFYVDPMGGGNLEDARYLGEDNIYKTKADMLAGAKAGYYDKKAVVILVNNLTPNTVKDNDNAFKNKASRLAALGLSSSMHNFMADGALRFIESGTTVAGVRYHVIWNYETGQALRCVKWTEDFKSGLWCWVSWATHRDSFNFWSKAPADDIRPIAEAMKVLTNQELDNRQKRNFGQRAYDPEMFPNGAELEYRPNGLVPVKAGASKVQEISRGIYEFQTPELQGTINLVEWLDGFAGKKSGVTSDAQGQSSEQKVGIYQGNLQQVADRLGLINKSYIKCHAAIGRRFVCACDEHLTTPMAVKLIGENGVEWDELRSSDINPQIDIKVDSGASEMQMNEAKKERRSAALAAISADPALAGAVNAKWRVEQILLNGEFTDEEVRVAQDVENNGNREVLARAAEAIQEIVKGKEPKLFRGATTGFQQKILDFALDNTDGDKPLFDKLLAYSSAHDEIVMENMTRQAMKNRMKMSQTSPMAAQNTPPSPAIPPQDMGSEMPQPMQLA